MPYHRDIPGLARARVEAERRVEIDQDRRTRAAVQEARAQAALYSSMARRIETSPIHPPKEN